MKKLLLILLISISVNSFSQITKADSLLIIETNKYIDSIPKKTSISEYMEWMYENVSAKQYNEFMQFYNVFLQRKCEEYYNQKKRQKKDTN
jgi:hypothetical protein